MTGGTSGIGRRVRGSAERAGELVRYPVCSAVPAGRRTEGLAGRLRAARHRQRRSGQSRLRRPGVRRGRALARVPPDRRACAERRRPDGHRRPVVGRRAGTRLCPQLPRAFPDRGASEGAAAIRRPHRHDVERGARSRGLLPDGHRPGDVAGPAGLAIPVRSQEHVDNIVHRERRDLRLRAAPPHVRPASGAGASGSWQHRLQPERGAWDGDRSRSQLGGRGSDGSTSCRAWRPFCPVPDRSSDPQAISCGS